MSECYNIPEFNRLFRLRSREEEICIERQKGEKSK